MFETDYNQSIRKAVLGLLLILVSLCGYAKDNRTQSTNVKTSYELTAVKDSALTTTPQKKSFIGSLPKPIRWVIKNWSAYDPHYSTPSFYNWVIQLQNTTSMEWLRMWTPEGMDVTLHSKISNKIGPYLGFRFIMFGSTVDLNALDGTNNRSEFTLSINSNLFNIDLIRRRTGGDFSVSRLNGAYYDPIKESTIPYSFNDVAHQDNDMGDMVRLSLTGVNINYFTNHRHYSNPAAFSNGAIQLRSVGSPIIGFGYVHQKMTNQIGNAIAEYAIGDAFNKLPSDRLQDFLNELNNGRSEKFSNSVEYYYYMRDLYNNSRSKYCSELKSLIGNSVMQPILFGEKDNAKNGLDKFKSIGLLGYFTNGIPSEIVTDDWHLQLGYAYNLVFSRRLLLGLSLVASPALKHVKYNNYETYGAQIAGDFAKTVNDYYEEPSAISENDVKVARGYTGFGLNGFARLSLTYNNNRWRAGFKIDANTYNFVNKDFSLSNTYGNVSVYVGWCFGRKKMYKDGQREHETYVNAALSKLQIAEKNDSAPESNIGRGNAFLQQGGRTKYHNDILNLEINGFDLVKGPDGSYGSFTIEDGIVAPGQDTENELRPGVVLPMDEKGDITITAGHRNSFIPANWWKRRIAPNKVPYNENMEMLHYALKGKLVFYVRSLDLGTRKPVKVEFDNFYINHGNDGSKFFQIASDDMESHSSFSIIGNKSLNGRLCRIYVEAKESGYRHDIYINVMRKSGRSWMKELPNDRPVSRVSIPATHDAGTASLPEIIINSAAHTQNFTIGEQLEDGIRAFDIRLKSNMKFGHTFECRRGFDETMKDIKQFLTEHPSEFIIAMIGSDEGGNEWSDSMKINYSNIISQYSDLFTKDFDATTKVGDVRGKILVIRRQEACPYGKLLKFSANTVFSYDCFEVEDVFNEHKTYKKCKIVADHLRNAYENDDPSKWYITFNSIAWDPRHHKPYYTAWGEAVNVRKPMNPTLLTLLYRKRYTNLGMIFLDFYNDHGDKPALVEAIIDSNFMVNSNDDFIPAI